MNFHGIVIILIHGGDIVFAVAVEITYSYTAPYTLQAVVLGIIAPILRVAVSGTVGQSDLNLHRLVGSGDKIGQVAFLIPVKIAGNGQVLNIGRI